ncbi:MAG: hypothetical protein AAFP78_14400 [Pseudomonadota bacterium]
MTKDQIAAALRDLDGKLDQRFSAVEQRFEVIDQRFESIEKHMVTRSDVHGAVFQGLAFAAAAIVGTVVVLNALGLFS